MFAKYVVANLEKFVRDNPDMVGNQAAAILKRAQAHSKDDIIPGEAIEEILGGNHALFCEFLQQAGSDQEHLRINRPMAAVTQAAHLL